jgi:hypothetical protein
MLRRRLRVPLVAVTLGLAGCGSHAPTAGTSPTRATAIGSTLQWFAAINAHDPRRVQSDFSPDSGQKWAPPDQPWSKFTHLHCRLVEPPGPGLPHPNDVRVSCTFHESTSPTEGNPVTSLDVYLHQSRSGWLIDGYGQG